MRYLKAVCAVLTLVMISACANLSELREKSFVASDYNTRLSYEYLALAEASKHGVDYTKSEYFADKGLRASRGEAVAPDSPQGKKMDAAEALVLMKARQILESVKTEQNKAKEPARLAKAQIMYECWLSEVERSSLKTAEECEAGFKKLVANMYAVHNSKKSLMVDASPMPAKTPSQMSGKATVQAPAQQASAQQPGKPSDKVAQKPDLQKPEQRPEQNLVAKSSPATAPAPVTMKLQKTSAQTSAQTTAPKVVSESGDKSVENRVVQGAVAAPYQSTQPVQSAQAPQMPVFSVFFDPEFSTVKPEARYMIADIAKHLKTAASYMVKITGYANDATPDTTDAVLSMLRAQSVQVEFMKRGIKRDKFTIKTGESCCPSMKGDTSAGTNNMRRVDIEIVR